MLGLVACFCCNGVVFFTEGLLSNFDEREGPGVCEVLSLVSCFCCNGLVFFTEEIVPILG